MKSSEPQYGLASFYDGFCKMVADKIIHTILSRPHLTSVWQHQGNFINSLLISEMYWPMVFNISRNSRGRMVLGMGRLYSSIRLNDHIWSDMYTAPEHKHINRNWTGKWWYFLRSNFHETVNMHVTGKVVIWRPLKRVIIDLGEFVSHMVLGSAWKLLRAWDLTMRLGEFTLIFLLWL